MKRKAIRLSGPVLTSGMALLLANLAAPQAAPGGDATLGFSYRTVPDDVANEIGVEGGLEVRAVARGSAAEAGGLRKGDLLREANGVRIDTAAQYQKFLRSLSPGDRVAFKVVRDRRDVVLQLTARERGPGRTY